MLCVHHVVCSPCRVLTVRPPYLQLVTGLKGKRVVQIGCGLQHTVALTA